MKIVHISDLHLTSPTFVPEWEQNVVNTVNSIQPDILVVTGDLTDWGYEYEYRVVSGFFEKIKANRLIVVPGNHDSRNEGYLIFEEIFGTRYPYYEDNEVVILGIDSSEPDIDDGHIGRENYDIIKDRFWAKDKIKILALHHHLIPIPGTGRERHIPVDAGDVLRLCTELEINFIFSGHKHQPWIWKLEKSYFATAGTATTRRLKGRSFPSFNILDISQEKLTLYEVNVAQKSTKEIKVILRGEFNEKTTRGN
ncbi:MAG: hypothetical protein KatS3mg078_0643 [Deltaproteobacteria bacterium]|jgi:Icc protein|nr:MAG: hypothetical protein KatS3mg078_0643 [Deltaproteobacteria bacterium]